MAIGGFIGMLILMFGTLLICLRINTFIFGPEGNYTALLITWFGMLILVTSFIFGVVECREKARKMRGRKNPKAIDEL